jgi:hypothetical protein
MDGSHASLPKKSFLSRQDVGNANPAGLDAVDDDRNILTGREVLT